jgi:predicted Zn-dependent protease
MRKQIIIPCVIAAFVAGACGDRHSQAGDANAAEVATVTPEGSSVSTATGPKSTQPVSFESANAAFAEKRYDEAVRLFTTYTTDKPDNVWGFYMLGLSAWKTGDRDAAVRAFTQALEKDSTHVKSRLNLSRVLIEQGKAQEALPYVEGVVTIDSTSNEAYRLLGRVKRELGDSTGAIEAFKKAIVLDEHDAWSMNNLAKVYIGQGRYEDALGPLARAIEIDSTVAAFHTNLGRALERTADRSRLAEAFVEQVKTWR